MVDPIRELVHDHRELNGLLVALHESLLRLDRGASVDDELHEIQDGIEAFREELFEHFAREQEGLFPFVVARLPALRERADGLVDEHDRVSKLLTAVVRDLRTIDDVERTSGERPVSEHHDDPIADRRGALAVWEQSLRRFEELYAAHTKAELALLDEVAGALGTDASATEQLRALLDEI